MRCVRPMPGQGSRVPLVPSRPAHGHDPPAAVASLANRLARTPGRRSPRRPTAAGASRSGTAQQARTPALPSAAPRDHPVQLRRDRSYRHAPATHGSRPSAAGTMSAPSTAARPSAAHGPVRPAGTRRGGRAGRIATCSPGGPVRAQWPGQHRNATRSEDRGPPGRRSGTRGRLHFALARELAGPHAEGRTHPTSCRGWPGR